jgi:capsular exopolysaccharide synthesis family protein
VVVHDATAGPSAPMLNNGVPAFYKEAFRNVRTSLLFASGEDQKHTVLVTSTGPNEGKSVVASNLAIGLAQTGRRVLLIDGDLRRPSLHQMFGVEQAPGLAELASGASRPDDVMRKTSIHDLALIAAGALPDNPAELLSSQRFKAFLTAVAPSFDWVIIDSPPVMAVTDPVLIAHIVEGVIFVVGAERTTGPLALNALEKLHAAHARFVGVVLNQVNLEGDRFFYADHYRQEYQAYYGRSH